MRQRKLQVAPVTSLVLPDHQWVSQKACWNFAVFLDLQKYVYVKATTHLIPSVTAKYKQEAVSVMS